MSARSFSDIPNRYTHILVQEAGAEYDRARRLPPLKSLKAKTGSSAASAEYNRHVAVVLKLVGDTCAFCGDPAEDEDHLVPRNRTFGGLHAWGNVVPACRSCNAAKSQKTWAKHLDNLVRANRLTDEESAAREAAIRSMIDHFAYKPQLDALLPVVEDLYRHADVQARSLVQFALSALRPFLETLAEEPRATPGSEHP